jgi:hypothetical protein
MREFPGAVSGTTTGDLQIKLVYFRSNYCANSWIVEIGPKLRKGNEIHDQRLKGPL